MSHQTVQTCAFVTVTDLELLARAVSAIQVPHLNTRLVLDREKTSARYYGTRQDDDCFAVITYGRPLTPSEQQSNYEIGVKKKSRDINGVPTTVYDLMADINASDRTMQDKIASVFEEYQIAVVTDAARNNGAIEVEELFDDVPEGYRKIRVVAEN